MNCVRAEKFTALKEAAERNGMLTVYFLLLLVFQYHKALYFISLQDWTVVGHLFEKKKILSWLNRICSTWRSACKILELSSISRHQLSPDPGISLCWTSAFLSWTIFKNSYHQKRVRKEFFIVVFFKDWRLQYLKEDFKKLIHTICCILI